MRELQKHKGFCLKVEEVVVQVDAGCPQIQLLGGEEFAERPHIICEGGFHLHFGVGFILKPRLEMVQNLWDGDNAPIAPQALLPGFRIFRYKQKRVKKS